MACMIYDKTSLTTSITTLSKFSDKYLPISWTCRRVFLRVRWLFCNIGSYVKLATSTPQWRELASFFWNVLVSYQTIMMLTMVVKLFRSLISLEADTEGHTLYIWRCTMLTRNAWNFKSHLRAVVYTFLVWFSFHMFFVIIIHPLSKMWGSSTFLYLTL